jgi:hypothetical protein
MNQINSVHIFSFHSFRIMWILSFRLRLGLPNGLFLSGFPTYSCVFYFFLVIRANPPIASSWFDQHNNNNNNNNNNRHTSRNSSCHNRSIDITIFHGFAFRVFIRTLRYFHGWHGIGVFSYGAPFAVMTLIWCKIYSIRHCHHRHTSSQLKAN